MRRLHYYKEGNNEDATMNPPVEKIGGFLIVFYKLSICLTAELKTLVPNGALAVGYSLNTLGMGKAPPGAVVLSGADGVISMVFCVCAAADGSSVSSSCSGVKIISS